MTESRLSSQRLWFLPIILFALILVGLTWMNFQFASQNPGGNDFLPRWLGIRELIIEGNNPYSDETAKKIQIMAYGHRAYPGEDEMRFAYPLYSGVIFTPFALVEDYRFSRALWMTVLEVAIVGLALICLRLTRWEIHSWMFGFFIIFSLIWYHAVRPLINGNAVIIVVLFVAGVFTAIKFNRDEFAGVLLALSTIKPQVVILIILFVLMWAISVKRYRILIWFIITMVVLFISAMLFLPDWFLHNIREVLRYPGYTPPGTPKAVLATWWPILGNKLGWALTIILGLVLITEWNMACRKGYAWFLWTGCLTLVISQLIGIQTDPGNFILLFIPLVLMFSIWEKRWGRIKGRFVVISLMLFLLVGIWALFLTTVEYGDQPQQAAIMFFPLPFLILLGLYWVRWWAIKPSQFLIEALQNSEHI